MRLRLPPKVSFILDILERHGFEAYAVGGCVRDLVLARTPNDWDVTTSARPEQVKACFRRTVDTGLKHGTVTVMLEKDAFEVTTYRIDGDYSDSRHPDSVVFTSSLEQDLLRRDFTINAMAYSDRGGLVDISGGMRDLQKRVIRCVGSPDRRFGEDALRVMRAVRFAAQLGFSIEPATAEAAARHASGLSRVSAERIAVELLKLLTSPYPEMILEMRRLGITARVLPEFDRMMETPVATPSSLPGDTVGAHTVRALRAMPEDRILRLTALLYESGKPETAETDEFGWTHFPEYWTAGARIADGVIRRLKLDNATRKAVTNLIGGLAFIPETDAASVRKSMHLVGPESFDDYLALLWADKAADRNGEAVRDDDPDFMKINSLYDRERQILRMGDPLSVKDLAVDGTDLESLGYRGPEIGEFLKGALDEVLGDPGKNTKEHLLALASERKGAG